jgi:hypothetical protein
VAAFFLEVVVKIDLSAAEQRIVVDGLDRLIAAFERQREKLDNPELVRAYEKMVSEAQGVRVKVNLASDRVA